MIAFQMLVRMIHISTVSGLRSALSQSALPELSGQFCSAPLVMFMPVGFAEGRNVYAGTYVRMPDALSDWSFRESS